MRALAVTSLAAAFALLGAAESPAFACSCRPRTEAEIIAASDVAVVGRVTEVKRGRADGAGVTTATLSVSRVLKGKAGKRVMIRTPSSSAACGVNFTRGETMRVAATRGPDGLSTTLCMALGARG
jgi:hypothetical protein